LERTFIRVGNEEYARDNKSFGLTTMQDRHVEVKGSKMQFRFRGKSGIQHEVDVTDRHIAKIVSKMQDLPGQELFQFVDDDGEVRDITSQDVNDYLREITNEDFTAKDFRTWAGTVMAAIALQAVGGFETKKQAKANIKNAIGAVSKMLGNTPAICRKCYIHPAVLETYLSGNAIEGLKQRAKDTLADEAIDLREGETAILKFLQERLEKKAA
ncbi:MAG TPA: DNA topoisomerase IB, partial [Chthoniobacterales bacterium]